MTNPKLHSPITLHPNVILGLEKLCFQYENISFSRPEDLIYGIEVGYYVYIMTNRPKGSLYIGVTNNLIRRVYERRNGLIDGFTQMYKIKKLVYYETYQQITEAIQREKNLKRWYREWKIQLIEEQNPHWGDLWKVICR